jgi:hypothetical protein
MIKTMRVYVLSLYLACMREVPPAKALCGGQALRRRQVLGIWSFSAFIFSFPLSAFSPPLLLCVSSLLLPLSAGV